MSTPSQGFNHGNQATGNTQGRPSLGEARPYRSHKIPACDRCRKRKLRCAVDSPGQPCLLCSTSGANCTQTQRESSILLSPNRIESAPQNFQSTGLVNHTHVNHANHPAKHQKTLIESPTNRHGGGAFAPNILLNNTEAHISANSNAFTHESAPPESAASKSSLIVGPVMAEDVQLIENYMSSHHSRSRGNPRGGLYDTVSDNPNDPVLYLTVPRRRQGLTQHNRPGEKQREILEQILGTLKNEVVAVYFEYIHPSFPVLDEEQFKRLFREGNSGLSAALVCDLLASALVFWNRSEILRRYPCPDIQYAWNLAVAALQEEFLAPGMSTIHAVILDLNGRPTTSITGNTINSGRTVGLSHILGLNRDPATWKISEAEKSMRVRLWWGVLIHDRWSSFAHGVPTFITKNQYEVPIPTVSTLMTPGLETNSRVEAARCFIALCTLTEILGEILPLVYDRRQQHGKDISKTLRRLQTDLDNWEDSDIAISVLSDRGNRPPISGSSSLKLGFLSAKMLICRISFRNATHTSDTSLLELKQYTQATLRESARSILSFLCSLKSHHLHEFWSSYTAYHIASATIILLRCAIESNDSLIAENCKNSLRDCIDWLKRAREMDGWDLADICLAQCEGPVGQFCSNASVEDEVSSNGKDGNESVALVYQNGEVEGLDPGMFGFGFSGGVHMGPSVIDTQNNVNGFEYPWADLWDLF